MSLTWVGALIAMPMAVLSAMRARLTAFCARIRLTRALATSTSARVTSKRGRVPTSKKPLALRRFRSRAIEGLGVDDDEPAGEQQAVLGLLHGQRR